MMFAYDFLAFLGAIAFQHVEVVDHKWRIHCIDFQSANISYKELDHELMVRLIKDYKLDPYIKDTVPIYQGTLSSKRNHNLIVIFSIEEEDDVILAYIINSDRIVDRFISSRNAMVTKDDLNKCY